MTRSGWLAIGATAGALAGGAVGPMALVVATGVAAAGVCLLPTPLRRQAVRALLVAAAAALILIRGAPLWDRSPASGPSVGVGPWTALVESISSPRDGRRPAVIRIASGADPPRVAARLPLVPEVVPSTTIVVAGALEDVPDGPYGAYLDRIGVSATLEARSLSISEGAPGGPSAWLEGVRQIVGDALETSLPEPVAGLAAGIVVGLRDRVDRDLAADFTTTGVSHVVAISGWNIAIVAGAVMAAASRVRRRRRAFLAIATIAAYTLFAGASASVVRAAVMAAVALLAREAGRPAVAATALGWAVTLLVLIDPSMATDVGFQLSVLGTVGLIAWADPLEKRIRRIAGGRIPGPLAESLAISLAAQAATLPVVLATFGRLATVAPVVNLIVVPLIPPAMAASLLAFVGGTAALAGAPEIVGVALGLPAWALLSLAIGAVRIGAGLPGASLAIEPPFDALAGASAALILLFVWRRPTGATLLARATLPARPTRPATATVSGARRSRTVALPQRTLIVALVAIAVAGTSTATAIVSLPDGALRITVLDVGQGDAILLEGPAGGRMLVDGGPDPDRLRLRLDERLPPWDRRIDAVVLTHPHEDHVAGLLALAARYRVARFHEPGMRGPGPGYRAWSEGLERAGLETRGLFAGARLSLDGITLRVLWPERGSVPDEPADDGTAINNVSIVLLGAIGRQRFLLTGDVEEDVDPFLLARGLPHIDVLKVAHHGSRTSSTEAFLDAVRPTVAVVSAGRGNPYGHPTKATIGRLKATGADVLRTDEDGSVTIRLDGRSIAKGTTRARSATTTTVGPETRIPLATSGFGCLIRPAPAARPDRSTIPAGPPETLRYHPIDELWHVPRPEIRAPDPAPDPDPAICEPRRTTIASAGRRRRP